MGVQTNAGRRSWRNESDEEAACRGSIRLLGAPEHKGRDGKKSG